MRVKKKNQELNVNITYIKFSILPPFSPPKNRKEKEERKKKVPPPLPFPRAFFIIYISITIITLANTIHTLGRVRPILFLDPCFSEWVVSKKAMLCL